MYSLPIKAVVNAKYEFMYLYACCTGCTHESVSFGCSGLFRILHEEGLKKIYSIAGDATYKFTPALLTPWSK